MVVGLLGTFIVLAFVAAVIGPFIPVFINGNLLQFWYFCSCQIQLFPKNEKEVEYNKSFLQTIDIFTSIRTNQDLLLLSIYFWGIVKISNSVSNQSRSSIDEVVFKLAVRWKKFVKEKSNSVLPNVSFCENRFFFFSSGLATTIIGTTRDESKWYKQNLWTSVPRYIRRKPRTS